MRAKSSGKYIFVVCVAWLCLTACQHQPSIHILFIGNSYTYLNGGIDKQVEGLAPQTETTSLAIAAYSLEKHWNDGKALETIRQGGWDYVVLQEQSQFPVINQKSFDDYASKFDEEIRRQGGKTVLLMTWERPDSRQYGVTTAAVAASYSALGAELGAKVAPAGLAFERALKGKPDLTLYIDDGHPTLEGTYLAACVLYGKIFEQSPLGNAYVDPKISAETAAYLQQAAAASLGY
jgi:hypothetical protein